MQNKAQKNLWCVVEDIPQNTIFMMGPPIKAFFELWPKKGLGDKLTKYFTLFKGDFSQMCYLRREFDEQAEFLASKMIVKPDWTLNIINQVKSWSDKFFVEARKIKKLNFSKSSNKELIKAFDSSIKWEILSHGIGASVSWHADADKERITKAITKVVDDKIKEYRLKLSTPEVFTTLSTPKQESLIQKEEKEFLQVGAVIYKQTKLRETFIQSDLDWLENELETLDKNIYQKIIRHYKKYSYLPYQYKGPAYSLSDFLGRWQALFRERVSPQKMLNKTKSDNQKFFKKQNSLMTKLKFNDYEKKLIKLSQQLVFIKDYRKAALFNGMYCYEPFFKEVGKRLGLSLDQVRAMNYWEIPEALLKNKFNVNELNERLKFCVAYCDKRGYKVLVGRKAKEFMKKIKFEKVKTKNINELTGTCACTGKVQGIVKIINVPEEMDKMEEGNILVAHNTNPNLVPAMKKAKALISEAGGLTCHTAIVARELKTPCLVGVSMATKILRDGDKIEVNASEGIIKKI